MTMVGAPSSQPVASFAGLPSMVTNHFLLRADQVYRKDAAGKLAPNAAVGFPCADAGTGPNRKPMSRATLTGRWLRRASASSVAVRAYSLCGAGRLARRK